MLSELTQEAMTKEGWKFAAEYTETTSKGTRICVEYVKPAAQEPTFTLEQVRKVVQDEGDRISWQGFGAQESFADAVCALLAAGFRAELAKEEPKP